MKKVERLAHINERAYELTESGTCRNWLMIEMKVSAEGFEEAQDWLENKALRMILDEICARNWGGSPNLKRRAAPNALASRPGPAYRSDLRKKLPPAK